MTAKTCALEDCEEPLYANSVCRKHYDRLRRRGTIEPPAPREKPECTEDGCEKDQHSQGLCQMHYRRLRKHGSTAVPQRVNKPGPKPDPSKPHSKHRPAQPRVSEEKTHCPQGHPYDEENTYIDGNGYKHCRTCQRDRMAERRPKTVGQGGHNKAKTQCPKGHPYDEGNTIFSKDGRRSCKACAKVNTAKQVIQKYGITLERFEELLQEQEGKCAICLTPFDGEAPHIDHDHVCCSGYKACGKCVRGLLCAGCNRGLGCFEDNRHLLLAAAEYLNQFSS